MVISDAAIDEWDTLCAGTDSEKAEVSPMRAANDSIDKKRMCENARATKNEKEGEENDGTRVLVEPTARKM